MPNHLFSQDTSSSGCRSPKPYILSQDVHGRIFPSDPSCMYAGSGSSGSSRCAGQGRSGAMSGTMSDKERGLRMDPISPSSLITVHQHHHWHQVVNIPIMIMTLPATMRISRLIGKARTETEQCCCRSVLHHCLEIKALIQTLNIQEP